MYELLGVVVIMVLLFKLRNNLHQVLFAATMYSLSLAVVAWYNHNIDTWFFSLSVASLTLTGVSVVELYSSKFLRESYASMQHVTRCCIPHFGCTSPDSVLFLTCLFRFLAGCTAASSFYTSWTFRDTFWTGHTDTVMSMWVISSSLWLLSCVPHFVCLLQCAAVNENPRVLYFRQRVSLWLLHDVVLGVFWLYLSMTLNHLLKDDDSEWRTIFLSMLSWHIIVYMCRQMYFSDAWSTLEHVSCCAPETVGRWSVVLMLVGMSAVYATLVHVVRDSVDMGCSLNNVVVVVGALFVGSLGYFMSGTVSVPVSLTQRKSTPLTGGTFTLDF